MALNNTVIAASVVSALTGSVDIGDVTHALNFGPNFTLQDGAGVGQANQLFADNRTLAASASESLDLSGTLVNAVGATINFTKIKALLIRASADNTNDVVIGGAASNGFVTPFGAATDKVKVPAGGLLLLGAPKNGFNVTAGTGDLLQIANGGAGTSVNYDIILIGVA